MLSFKIVCVFLCLQCMAVAPSYAACLTSDQRIAPEKVSAFVNGPGAMLKDFPKGGSEMISRVRDLVESDPASLKAVISLLKPAKAPSDASSLQRFAVGAGLANAALGCSERDPAFAAEIQASLAESGDHDALLGYGSVIGEVPIAAGGGGGGGGGGGSGGPTAQDSAQRASSSLQTFGNWDNPNLGQSLFSGGGVSSGFLGAGVNGGGITINRTFIFLSTPLSVSPH